jgi:hypothetical protein
VIFGIKVIFVIPYEWNGTLREPFGVLRKLNCRMAFRLSGNVPAPAMNPGMGGGMV